ncbi:uncharacterized protein OGAPODRAFT_14634 [Ogataea polymorpha]|uniref:uncharacterized protein n=1 Tax=Ogataea polymorpha TaxID=460523 RepID=UPI0007F4C7F9|nr:uncharacterized protein OGAPODRAFT_14634 [Ogataea polymorpha]OBA13529.1 hypothetical protein OGAPODRAFT_14634 [Ogataea polymorpha]
MTWHWNWETVWWSFHILALFLRLECVSWLSYIHPDEFFQTFQPLFDDNVPWEFQHACRSIVPIKWIQIVVQSLGESPIGSYKLVKLIYSLMTLIAIQVTLRKLHLRRRDFSTALLLADTSYVTLVYQSHTFSNSIETCVLLYTVWIINDMRKALETKEKSISSYKLLFLGFLVSFGIFNRVTFVAWLVLPAIFVLKYGLRNKLQSLLAIQSFVFFSLIFIAADSYYFTGSINTSIITPLNNLLYNSKISNLAQHGLHPYYQHVLVNYPTMFGPLIFLVFPFTTKNIKSTSFLTVASGMIVLSLVPHQELRFLIPMVPLWASCVDISRSTIKKVLLMLWIPFNLGMLVFMGKLHQGGVIPAMQELQHHSGNFVFWRTYKPPTWFLQNGSLSYINKDEPDFANRARNATSPFVIDCMGYEYESLEPLLSDITEANGH